MLLRARARRLLSNDPAVAESFKQLRSVSARYAQRIGKLPESDEDRKAWRDDLQRMNEQIETLEKQIAAKSEVGRAYCMEALRTYRKYHAYMPIAVKVVSEATYNHSFSTNLKIG